MAGWSFLKKLESKSLMTESESNPFSKIGIEYCAARGRGEYFGKSRDQTRTVLFHPKGQCNTCFDDSGLRMACGHYICPDCLLTWTWEQLSNMKHEIGCNECGKPIKQDDIIKFGLPTLEEKQFIITAITTNFYESQNIQECPQCRTLCQRTRTDTPQVHCTVCPKKAGKFFMFCWYCMREWKNASDYQVCGNANCKKELIEKLVKSPKKKFTDRQGRTFDIPTIRACPRCQTMLEHSDGCNTFTCSSSSCKHIFCFICLSASKSCKSISWNETGIRCSPAPIQTS